MLAQFGGFAMSGLINRDSSSEYSFTFRYFSFEYNFSRSILALVLCLGFDARVLASTCSADIVKAPSYVMSSPPFPSGSVGARTAGSANAEVVVMAPTGPLPLKESVMRSSTPDLRDATFPGSLDEKVRARLDARLKTPKIERLARPAADFPMKEVKIITPQNEQSVSALKPCPN
jgi:hypothetical protein